MTFVNRATKIKLHIKTQATKTTQYMKNRKDNVFCYRAQESIIFERVCLVSVLSVQFDLTVSFNSKKWDLIRL